RRHTRSKRDWSSDVVLFRSGKKDRRRASAFPSGSWASSPSGPSSGGVKAGDGLCLFLAHLTRFQRPDCDVDASSTLWRWVSRRTDRNSVVEEMWFGLSVQLG